jgi:hypothetical protein
MSAMTNAQGTVNQALNANDQRAPERGVTAIGCVTRVHDGEIWVVPGSTAPKDPGVQRLVVS